MNFKFLTIGLIIFIAGFFAGSYVKLSKFQPHVTKESPVQTQHKSSERHINVDNAVSSNHGDRIPAKVYEVLEYIKKYDRAPEGYVGGREFKNREGQLESQSKNGHAIKFQEWDVNPKIQGQNRGRERLITGDDGRAWYTNDHYKTFTEIK